MRACARTHTHTHTERERKRESSKIFENKNITAKRFLKS